jgi:hypothetical protein
VADQADKRGVLGLRDTYGYVYGFLENTVKDELLSDPWSGGMPSTTS